jgi:hypothetical protein
MDQKYASFDRRFHYNVHHALNQMRGGLGIEIQANRTGQLISEGLKKPTGAEGH